MSLQSALSIASDGLAVVQRQISVVSQNVANASTTGYVREIATQTSLEAGGQPSGVASGPTQRALDAPLQASVLSQNATVAGLQTTAGALSAIDAAQGTTGTSGTSLATLTGGLQTAFLTLQGDPSSAPQQQAVVGAAQSLASGINSLSTTYTAQRQAAQDSIAQQIGVANQTLSQIGSTSQQIVLLKAQGVDVADLENQRDEQVQSLSSLLSVHTNVAADGEMTVTTDNGTVLPTHDSTGPLSTTDVQLAVEDSYADPSAPAVPGAIPGVIPAIKIGTTDVTASLTGGSIGANITLRDKTLPLYQAELDQYSQTLSTQFQNAGMTLFTSGSNQVPPPATTGPIQAPYIGLAASLAVNPAVVSNPSEVRDGTAATPTGGTVDAGNTAVINSVLNVAFAPTVTSATTGLGPRGNLNAPYGGTGGLVSMAATLVASQSQDSFAATTSLATQTGVQTTLTSQFSTASGVSVDQELSNMVQLQNAYGAGGKIIAAVEAMFTSLLAAVNPS